MDLVELKQLLDQEFRNFAFGRAKFPMLFNAGIDDAAVHSAGVSYLLALGIELGIPAIAEYPVIVHSNQEWKKTPKVMPDSVWFHPQTQKPWIAFEFERFEKGDETKIQDKVRNLALSYYQSCETIELCVLIYWLRSGIAPRAIDPLLKIFEQGFQVNGLTVAAPRCSLSLHKFVFCQVNSGATNRNLQIKDEKGIYVTSSDEIGKLSICSATKLK